MSTRQGLIADMARDERFRKVPDRSFQQRMAGLQSANKIRTFRANLKQEIKAERESVVDLLLNPPNEIKTMKIFDLLLAMPKMGRVKANKLVTHCRISPSKTIGGINDRQREELVAMMLRRP